MNKTQLKYGRLCRPKHQVLIMVLFVVSLVATGLGGQTLAPASASHTTVDGVPRVGSYTDPDPDSISFGWSKHGHNCGFWGCGDDFWVTSTKGVTAEWYLPDIQGVFTFSRNLGKNFRIDNTNGHTATGTVEWTIWERRVDSRSYELVHTFNPVSQRDRLGWRTFSDVGIELDGAVKVIAKAKEHGKRIGVKDVRLNHIDVLPELKEAAIELCKAGVVKALNVTATVPSALAAAVVVVYAAPLIASGVGGIAGAKLLTPKALGWLIPAILPDGPATAEDYVKGVIEDWVIDLIKDLLSGVWDKLNEFYGKAVESYQHGCRYFKAPAIYLGITLGYGNYADDLAETYGRRRSSTTTPADTTNPAPPTTTPPTTPENVEPDPTPQGPFTAITAGGHHSCGLRTDSTAQCWGYDGSGATDAPSGAFTAITAGYRHSCGLRTDSTAQCWGSNDWDFGQTDAPSGAFTAITAGSGHSCGLRTDGTAQCWGGRGAGAGTDAPSGAFTAITAGWRHSCGLRTDGTAQCWGDRGSGQTDAPPGAFTAITAGWRHSCGLRTDGTAQCWGANGFGRADAPSGAFTAITAGGNHSCGLRTDGTAQCWGDNGSGATDAPSGAFTAITAGGNHSCGLRTDGTAQCWDWTTNLPEGVHWVSKSQT